MDYLSTRMNRRILRLSPPANDTGSTTALRQGSAFRGCAGPRVIFAVCVIALLAIRVLTADAQAQATTPGTPLETTIQLVQPPTPGQPGAPLTVTLQDALDRAQKNDAQFHAAKSDAEVAHEDRVQAKAALLPSVSTRLEYLGSEGGGVLQTGRFVTNDGVHVYRFWGVIHQDLSPNTYLATGYHRAQAAEAIAKAKLE